MLLILITKNNKMSKVEKKFFLDGETFELMYEKNDVKCFINDDDSLALITDKDGNVLFKIGADCGQNTGFLNFVDA